MNRDKLPWPPPYTNIEDRRHDQRFARPIDPGEGQDTALLRGLPQTPAELHMYRLNLARNEYYDKHGQRPPPEVGLLGNHEFQPSQGDPAGIEAARRAESVDPSRTVPAPMGVGSARLSGFTYEQRDEIERRERSGSAQRLGAPMPYADEVGGGRGHSAPQPSREEQYYAQLQREEADIARQYASPEHKARVAQRDRDNADADAKVAALEARARYEEQARAKAQEQLASEAGAMREQAAGGASVNTGRAASNVSSALTQGLRSSQWKDQKLLQDIPTQMARMKDEQAAADRAIKARELYMKLSKQQ